MSDTTVPKRLSKSGWAWISDWLIDHWPQIVWIGGASGMTYLASITVWLNNYGPVAYGAVGLSTYLIFMIGYAIYGIARKKIALSRLADERWKAGSINPLEGNFNKRRIKLSDFFDPFYKSIQTAKFQDCELLGPSNVYLMGCTLSHPTFSSCQVVIIEQGKKVIGVTAFENCIFERCKFYHTIFYFTRSQYIDTKGKSGKGIEVISDGKAGDL
jgi:hypothetical protein